MSPMRLAGSLAGLLAVAGPLVAQQPPSRVAWDQVADLVVSRSLALKPGDRVVLFHSPSLDRGALPALRAAIGRVGGVLAGEIIPPDSATLAARAGRSAADRARIARRQDSAWARVFSAADAAIWLPTEMAGLADRPFERLVERNRRVRSIHFHWFLPPDLAEVGLIDSLYAAAIAVPPATIKAENDRLDRAVRGATVRITAPNGTDLTLTVPATAWTHGNDGDASRSKGATVRDREEELPGGVWRTTGLRSVSGTLVGHVSFDTRSPVVAARFERGRVVELRSLRGADAIVAAWTAATGAKQLPAELVLGTNPALPAILPSGFMPYYAYGAGTVRLAIGDNWESGGPNRASNAGNVLFFIPGATVEANGVVVVRGSR